MAFGGLGLFNPALMGPPQRMNPGSPLEMAGNAMPTAGQAGYFPPAPATPQQPQGLGGFLQNLFSPNPAVFGPHGQQPRGNVFGDDPMRGMNIFQRFQHLSQNNPGALMALGAGMMEGDMAGGFRAAGDHMADYRERMSKQNELERSRNVTARALRNADPIYAQMLDAGIPPNDVFRQYAADRAKKADKRGNYINAGDGRLFNEDTGEWITAPGGGDEFAKRRQAAADLGMMPEHPAYQSYVLTGRMPREDQAPLTATDKKAILEADEMVMANEEVVRALDSVLTDPDGTGPQQSLNDRAGYGATAGAQSWLARNDPTGFFNDDKGQATTELNNVVLGQALSSLKSLFGAAPTEGERKILVDLQASVDKTPAERRAIIARAKALAERRLEFNRQRASQLRGGDFYRSGGNTIAPAQGSGSGTTSSGLKWSIGN
jgi:hypothetical protein